MLYSLEVVGSTNTCMKAKIEKGLVGSCPSFLVAKYQKLGKGMGENAWHSSPGKNILLSMAVKPQNFKASQQFMLNQALSLAILKALSESSARRLQSVLKLKWPNDVYYSSEKGNYKLGGILFEVGVIGNICDWAIMGIGININQTHFPPQLPNPVSVKRILSRELELSNVRDILVKELTNAYDCLSKRLKILPERQVMEMYKEEYLKKLLFYKEQRAYTYNSKEILATIEDVDEFGRAILKTSDNAYITCGIKELKHVF